MRSAPPAPPCPLRPPRPLTLSHRGLAWVPCLGAATCRCDNCIIGTMIAAQYPACLCSIAACLSGSSEINDAAQALDCVADVLWCT